MSRIKVIAIDARFYGEAGPGRYIKNIVEHLEAIDTHHKYYVFLSPKGYSFYKPTNTNFTKVLTKAGWYSWAEQTVFLISILLKRPDLFYVPHFNIPILYPGKLVTAIPDIIMHSFSTEKGTTLPKFYFKFKKLIYRRVLKWALIRSKKVIVPTYDVYSDISSHYPEIDKTKFVVAYEGVDPSYMRNIPLTTEIMDKLHLKKGKYLLYVSSMYEHKNVERLVRAFKTLSGLKGFDYKLVIVGKKDKFSSRIFELVNSLGLKNLVIMPGETAYVSDDEVTTLRKNAAAYVFPSLKEGFSLTPLEAQAVGLPCVISNISCHKEVFEDSVLYFDPRSVEDIVEKILVLLTNSDLQEQLRQKGFQNYKKYDWANTAKITLQIFNEILEKKKAR